MMPGDYPLDVYHGDTYRWQFLMWLDAAKSQPVNLAEATPKAEIRDKPAGTQIFPMECSLVLPNTIEVLLTSLTSNSLPVGELAWDLQLTYSDGAVNTVLAGKVTVVQDVTDSAEIVPNPLQQPKAKAMRIVGR